MEIVNQLPHQNGLKSHVDIADIYIEQYFVGCLAEFSYYIESAGEAIIIDPFTEPQPYIDILIKRNAKLKYILETHIHADFVGAQFDLQKYTGATIVHGPSASVNFEYHAAKDGEILKLGNVGIRVDHTPGHTPESSCFVLLTSSGEEYCVFTGDTLFLGEVGRPDLAQKANLTTEDLAGMLYDSLHNKLMKLPDGCIIYPGHGAGSACGKSIGSGVRCSMGQQKIENYALQPMPKEDFIHILTQNIQAPPQYFCNAIALNKGQSEHEHQMLMAKCSNALKYEDFIKATNDGAMILDSRMNITDGIIDQAMTILQSPIFANFVGTLIKPTQKLVLITDEGRSEEAVLRLLRIGYYNIVGYLEGGFKTYVLGGGKVVEVKIIENDQMLSSSSDQYILLDVRRTEEYSEGHLPGSINIPIRYLEEQYIQIPKDKSIRIFCKTGGRARMGMSILRRLGFQDIVLQKTGGVDQIAQACKIDLAVIQ